MPESPARNYATKESRATIANDFDYHPAATSERMDAHADVRATLKKVALKFDRELPPGREKSLVKTHLEEAMFWANAAISRQAE